MWMCPGVKCRSLQVLLYQIAAVHLYSFSLMFSYICIIFACWEFLLESLKSSENFKAIRKVLLAKDVWGRTAVHIVTANESFKELKKRGEWITEETPTLTYSFFFCQKTNSKTIWHLATEGDDIKMVEELWVWGKEAQINPNELQNKLLLAQDSEGRTAWHVAAERGSVELIDKMWICAKE